MAESATARARRKQRKRKERLARYARRAAGAAVPHGKLSSYNQWGCRCGPCTAAYMEWYSVYATRRKPSKKQLPPDLAELAESSSPEVAELIQAQYDDDQAKRVSYTGSVENAWDAAEDVA